VFGTHDFWLFILSGILLNITPGPDTLYVVSRSTNQGWRGGMVAALGIGTGTLVHICAAALGLSAILAASAKLFAAVKIVGALYLLYVGVGLILSAGRTTAAAPASTQDNRVVSMRAIFLQGFLTNALNPKVALFFLAFLPQFVGSDAPSKALAFLFLGVIFDFNGTLWFLFLAWSSARLTRKLAPSAMFKQWFNRCIGAMFILVGLRLALVRDR
jgi:threonine/homoserine/homoserine lactone efflux protein